MSKKNKTISPLIAHENPKSVISEKFRGIRTNITFSGIDEEINTLVITAEKPDAGKSTISSNVAVTYAQSGLKTLLIDGDMRKPTQHYIFNESNVRGLSTLVKDSGEVYDYSIQTIVDNLYLLPAGPIPPNPSELITSDSFYNIFQQVKKEFDMVIIDTPPVLPVTDAQIFSKIAKNVVLVLDADNNNRADVIKGKELIEKAGGKILGVILNKVAKSKGDSDYYYYYGEEK